VFEAAFTLDREPFEEAGVLCYRLRSPDQPGENLLRVLHPMEHPDSARAAGLLFVLPVEAGLGTTWGDGLREIQRLDLHNTHGLIAVAPSFSQLPWYADHPSDPAIRQESYLLRAALPAVDQLFPGHAGPRLLLGFSKSGWGALSLLARHPDLFAACAAWDAPLVQRQPNQYGMAPIFGTQENFDRYYLPRQLEEAAPSLRARTRLALLGYGGFREHMQRAHTLLEELAIPHVYADGPPRHHHWEGGWITEAIQALVEMRTGGEAKGAGDAVRTE
jgi:Putative esterase